MASKFHVSELIDLSEADRNAFMADVCKVSQAIHALYKPAKVNYGAYGDTGCHLHFHLVPKYVGGPDYPGLFRMNPQEVYLSDQEYQEMIDKIKAAL